ncbi:probable Putative nicotinamide N-methyltransferase [Saccharomycodes ludwigii]|uniref:Protein N-terminal and lysine N-methyltransferase EFM7 n=1 Tax=Saccharomycodes ludwigii TaxID=36035 RepID=A0A376B7X4_9ASCO|nr:hypothetical protein SCDLUD_000888 [Saccharomycodes ludwigii]KAH3903265.1 hypothetical protein SCDLUD_000888 [Saccharomycodes ludwigii]SSD60787.1 probable Putative nicotinamide N-methyltransferase [Saccharomycodes ludwigii]
MLSDTDSLFGEENQLFEEPQDFAPPPPEPHFASYKRCVTNAVPKEISLRLVGSSPLWGHLLWNAGIYTSNHLDKLANKCKEEFRSKTVLELGAAAGLPSIICGLNNAAKVVVTDYPDADLIENIKINVSKYNNNNNMTVEGYIWGNNYEPLLKNLPNNKKKFDLIIMSDLVFNHSEHHKLLKTAKDLLEPENGKVLVVFSPHRPHLLPADLNFFETCKKDPYNFKVEEIEIVNWKPMFEEDEETVEIRSRVYAYYLSLS